MEREQDMRPTSGPSKPLPGGRFLWTWIAKPLLMGAVCAILARVSPSDLMYYKGREVAYHPSLGETALWEPWQAYLLWLAIVWGCGVFWLGVLGGLAALFRRRKGQSVSADS